jgi:hypothetical protein
MTKIKTWQQRCMEHPDHQTGMVSDEMIRARMCEEIEELRALVADLERDADRTRSRAKLVERERRERIATACLSALEIGYLSPQHAAKDALRYADALIEEIDKEAKP